MNDLKPHHCPNCKRWLCNATADVEVRCRHCKAVWHFEVDTGRVRNVTMKQLRPLVAR